MFRSFSDALTPVVDFVYPPRCPLCGGAIAAQTGLCASCWDELAIPGEPACALCQLPLTDHAVDEGALCAPCIASAPRHDGIAAGTLYNDASRKLVLAFKHGRRIALADMLARLMIARLARHDPGEWLVVPVPLHRWRLWQRGFNQSALLASSIAKARGEQLVVDALIRQKATATLGGLGRKARARALAGAIGVNPAHRAQLAKAKVILVDDVLTSGATSSACVSALKRAGAEKVVITCFARVVADA
ncbi:MAG: ComF family protein [Sphingomonadales bacterium]|nr:ComF family protein [Sphingomonadales bacterium]MBD3774911.1 ComF family protein [Paracoccaceae bacterium]